MPNLQKKLNYPLADHEGLVAYLHEYATPFPEKRVVYDFFHDTQRPDMYGRIETHTVAHACAKYYLTIRKDAEQYEDMCPRDVYARHEVSIEIQNVQHIKTLLALFGFHYTHTKVQKRHSYTYSGLTIHIDNWYTEHIAEHIEERVEVVGDIQEEVKLCGESLRAFVSV